MVPLKALFERRSYARTAEAAQVETATAILYKEGLNSGNEVYRTNAFISLVKIKLCDKLPCIKVSHPCSQLVVARNLPDLISLLTETGERNATVVPPHARGAGPSPSCVSLAMQSYEPRSAGICWR